MVRSQKPQAEPDLIPFSGPATNAFQAPTPNLESYATNSAILNGSGFRELAGKGASTNIPPERTRMNAIRFRHSPNFY
jgi:hypothetical protein